MQSTAINVNTTSPDTKVVVIDSKTDDKTPLETAIQLFRTKKHNEAADLFHQIITDAPAGNLDADILFFAALNYFQNKDQPFDPEMKLDQWTIFDNDMTADHRLSVINGFKLLQLETKLNQSEKADLLYLFFSLEQKNVAFYDDLKRIIESLEPIISPDIKKLFLTASTQELIDQFLIDPTLCYYYFLVSIEREKNNPALVYTFFGISHWLALVENKANFYIKKYKALLEADSNNPIYYLMLMRYYSIEYVALYSNKDRYNPVELLQIVSNANKLRMQFNHMSDIGLQLAIDHLPHLRNHLNKTIRNEELFNAETEAMLRKEISSKLSLIQPRNLTLDAKQHPAHSPHEIKMKQAIQLFRKKNYKKAQFLFKELSMQYRSKTDLIFFTILCNHSQMKLFGLKPNSFLMDGEKLLITISQLNPTALTPNEKRDLIEIMIPNIFLPVKIAELIKKAEANEDQFYKIFSEVKLIDPAFLPTEKIAKIYHNIWVWLLATQGNIHTKIAELTREREAHPKDPKRFIDLSYYLLVALEMAFTQPTFEAGRYLASYMETATKMFSESHNQFNAEICLAISAETKITDRLLHLHSEQGFENHIKKYRDFLKQRLTLMKATNDTAASNSVLPATADNPPFKRSKNKNNFVKSALTKPTASKKDTKKTIDTSTTTAPITLSLEEKQKQELDQKEVEKNKKELAKKEEEQRQQELAKKQEEQHKQKLPQIKRELITLESELSKEAIRHSKYEKSINKILTDEIRDEINSTNPVKNISINEQHGKLKRILEKLNIYPGLIAQEKHERYLKDKSQSNTGKAKQTTTNYEKPKSAHPKEKYSTLIASNALTAASDTKQQAKPDEKVRAETVFRVGATPIDLKTNENPKPSAKAKLLSDIADREKRTLIYGRQYAAANTAAENIFALDTILNDEKNQTEQQRNYLLHFHILKIVIALIRFKSNYGDLKETQAEDINDYHLMRDYLVHSMDQATKANIIKTANQFLCNFSHQLLRTRLASKNKDNILALAKKHSAHANFKISETALFIELGKIHDAKTTTSIHLVNHLNIVQDKLIPDIAALAKQKTTNSQNYQLVFLSMCGQWHHHLKLIPSLTPEMKEFLKKCNRIWNSVATLTVIPEKIKIVIEQAIEIAEIISKKPVKLFPFFSSPTATATAAAQAYSSENEADNRLDHKH